MADKETELPFGLCEQDSLLLRSLHTLLKSLRSLTICNIEYYQRGRSSIHARFYATSCILLERTQLLEPLLTELIPHLKDYDFSETIQANGYRSFVSITNRCCLHLLQLCRHIDVNKTSLLFRSNHYLKELEDYVETLGQLVACLGYLKQLMSYGRVGELLMGEDTPIADDLLLEVEMLNTDCFYGRCLGFHISLYHPNSTQRQAAIGPAAIQLYHHWSIGNPPQCAVWLCESVQKLLPGILVAMATFSECYEENSQVMQLATSIFNSGKYVVDQDLRAKQVVDITRTADIKFCKAFWSIPESPLLSQLRSFTFPYVEVSEVISLEPENFELPLEGSTDGSTVTITPACAHTGPAPINVRLISQTLRDGMNVKRKRFQPKTGSSKPKVLGKSPALLFHCHGGGFVAQSSQSHENYLRMWACKLKIPILSVDYSLSPDLPFPRALEECFYAYAWALNNAEKLGWTGERVCFAGDSAGGNLAMSTALRAVSYEIRVPDGIMAAYPVFLVQYTPGPSRLLAMIDPLLPVGILTRCLAAYAGIADEFSRSLCKPIFCNPGNVENWEVVKDEDFPVDSLDIADHQSSPKQTETAVATYGETVINSRADEQSQSAAEVDGKTVINSRADEQVETAFEVIESTDESVINSREGEQEARDCDCDSLEEMESDQFVVCDVEEFEHDEAGYAGKILADIVDKVSKTDGERNVCHKNKDQTESENVNCNAKSSESDNLTASVDVKPDDVCRPKVPKLEQNGFSRLSQEQPPVLGSTLAGTTDTSDSLGEEGLVGKETVEDIINTIDSHVVIQVDSGYVDQENAGGSETDKSSCSYAMCQELLDAAQPSSHYGDYRQASDMTSTSCHSLEDLVEACSDDTPDVVRDDAHLGGSDDVDYRLGSQVCSPQHQTHTAKADKCTKQWSVSDTSDSGIHLDTDEEKSCDNGSTVTIDSNGTVCNGNGKTRAFTAPTQTMPKHELPKQRAFSLDLAGHQPGPVFEDRYSPKHSLHSPLSPKLPRGTRAFTPKRFSVQRKIAQSPIQLFKRLPIVKNLYMSPLLAPDELLKGLPPVYLMGCHFDPLLDDSIMFAKKLRGLGQPVELHVFDSLPHGFLCFADASLECKQAAVHCMETIRTILKLEE